jgi:hypothetical protein
MKYIYHYYLKIDLSLHCFDKIDTNERILVELMKLMYLKTNNLYLNLYYKYLIDQNYLNPLFSQKRLLFMRLLYF